MLVQNHRAEYAEINARGKTWEWLNAECDKKDNFCLSRGKKNNIK